MWFRDSFRPGSYGLYVYRINLSEPDRPGPHVWYRSARTALGTLTCDVNRRCDEAPSTIDFSDIKNNYTVSRWFSGARSSPATYWYP